MPHLDGTQTDRALCRIVLVWLNDRERGVHCSYVKGHLKSLKIHWNMDIKVKFDQLDAKIGGVQVYLSVD